MAKADSLLCSLAAGVALCCLPLPAGCCLADSCLPGHCLCRLLLLLLLHHMRPAEVQILAENATKNSSGHVYGQVYIKSNNADTCVVLAVC